MTNDLFLAILAMDAYNRTGGVSSVGLEMPSMEIGNATVLSGPGNVLEDTATGFYAQAYELSDGSKVISYRGTDDSRDAWYGWRVGAGSFTAAQAAEAAQFYQQVAAGSTNTSNLSLTNLYDADIALTGHSMGGGLAGLVGSLYGASDVRIFDPMSYQLAANDAYRAAMSQPSDHLANRQFAMDTYFLGGQPGQPIDGDDISSFSVAGQAIAGLASGASQTTFSLGFSSLATLGPIQRHSSSLLVIAMYGSTSPTVSSIDWLSVGQFIFPALYDDKLARQLGIQSGGPTGTDSASGKMRTMIAYSAIDNGVMPFGDTAIQAFFADANALGSVVENSGFSGLMAGDKVTNALAEILVQHAGDLAESANKNLSAESGILSASSNVLSIDLGASNWAETFAHSAQTQGQTTPSIIGLGDLAKAVLSNFRDMNAVSGSTASWIASVIKGSADFTQKLNQITVVDAAIGGGGSADVNGANAGTGSALLIGQLNSGSITGSAQGNDIIVGGATITTGKGDDTILAKSATINSGGGKNTIYADPQGGVDDTFNYESSSGSDLIIGDAQGGDTFTFNGADKAAFTVVWGGAGNDTFDINTTSSASTVNVVSLTMNGITANNLASLDMSALQSYVDNTYQYAGGAPTIVILNESSSDTLKYNGSVVSSPNVKSSDLTLVEAGGVEAWYVVVQTGWTNKLTANGLDYSLAGGHGSFPVLGLTESGGGNGAGGLNLLNFANGEFGVSLDAGVGVGSTVIDTRDFTLWEGAEQIQTPSGPAPVSLGEPTYHETTHPDYSDGNLVDPNVLNGPAAPAININDYLLAGSDNNDGGGGSGGGGGDGGGDGGDGGDGGSFTVSASQFASNQSNLDFQDGGFQVSDTAANISAAIDGLSSDSNVAGIALIDGGTPTLQLSALQVANDTAALTEITNATYVIAVDDSAAAISANFDALDANQNVGSITLSDGNTASLTLSVGQALLDTAALGKISNANYGIVISDTAADVSAAIDLLKADASISSITLVDSGTPMLDLSVSQAFNDTSILAKISNTSYAIQIEDTAENVLDEAAALGTDAQVTGITIVDTAANVLANASALAANSQVTSIVVEDTAANIVANAAAFAGNPQIKSIIVVDTAANVLADAGSLQGDAVVVSDTAANVSAALDALNADTGINEINLTDIGTPALTLSVTQALGDTTALGEIANSSYAVDISDTAADVDEQLDALAADAQLGSITLTDAGTPTLTVTAAQFVDDTAVLAAIGNSNLTIDVSDTAANVAVNIDAINSDPKVASINVTDSGTPTLSLDAAQALGDTAALAKIANPAYSIALSDAAADVSITLDALNADAKVGSITLTDSGTPSLTLSVAQVLGDTTALGEITNAGYQIQVFDTAANILSNNSALAANSHVASAVVVDFAATVLAQEAAIAADTKVRSVVVSDTATDVSANIDALNADSELGAVALTDSGVPTLTLSVAQALDDGHVISNIFNTNFKITISDTAANVAANIDVLNADGAIGAITLTDSGTPTLDLSVGQAISDSQVLSKITNQNYAIAISDNAADVIREAAALTADSHIASAAVTDTAANVSANFDALGVITLLSAIALTDASDTSLSLSASQALDDTPELSKIAGTYSIVVTDSVTDVLADEAALDSDTDVTLVQVTDTAANVLNNAPALAADSKVGWIAVSDTASNILADKSSLAANAKIRSVKVVDSAANIAANGAALRADSHLNSVVVVDSAANIAANIAALGQVSNTINYNVTIAGTPTLNLSAADALDVANIFGNYTIDVVDTAANIVANIDQLSNMSSIGAITPTDSGVATLSVTASQAVFDARTLGLIGGANSQIVVDDSAANVSAFIDAFNTDNAVAFITLNDGGTPTLALTVAQALDDTNALGKIANADYDVAISDTVANVLASATALQADSRIALTTVADTAANILSNQDALAADSQVTAVTVADTAANVVANSVALSGDNQVTAFEVLDTAASISANIDALNSLAGLSSIQVTDYNNLTLTAAQALNDTNVIDMAENFGVSVDVSDPAANIVSNLSALEADGQIDSISIVDTAANVVNNLSALEAASFSGIITVEDTWANIVAELPILRESSLTIQESITAPEVTITSAVEASNIATQVITGVVNYWGSAIVPGQTVTLTDNGTTLGTATLQADGTFTTTVTLPNEGANSIVATVTDGHGNMGTSAAVVDTLETPAQTVITSEVLANDTGSSQTDDVTSDGHVTLTGTTAGGSTVAIFDGTQDIGDATVSGTDWTFSTDLAEGTYQLYTVATDGGGSTTSSAPAPTIVVDATAPQPVISGIAQGQDATLALNGTSEAGSVAKVFDGTALLGTATTDASGLWSFTTASPADTLHTFSVTASDLAGNVGSGTGIVQYGGSGVDVVDTAGTLQDSDFTYSAADATWRVGTPGSTETLSKVEAVVDGTGHKFLLVGGGSQYTTIQAAVDAASSGDTILIAPGSYTEDVAITGKAITLEGFGGTTLHGSIAESGTLDGALTIDGIAVNATGKQYGVLVSANSTNSAGSVTLDNTSVANAELNGFAYIDSGNGSTPTNTDTIGSISIVNSVFSGNATQTSGANGRGDILLYGYNGNFTVNGVTIENPSAGAQKAIQVRGVQTSVNTVDVGPYQPSGDISLTNLVVSGTYAQDLLAFYRFADLGSFSASGVTLNAAAPWGLLNFDEVGGTIDLSNGISATNLAPGAPVAVEQSLNSNSTLVGTSGNDVLVSNGGVASLFGGAGDNTYVASPSTGQATIYATQGAGTTNELDFTGGITEQNLWFEQSGTDLKIDLLGTSTQVDVSGWFGSTNNQLQEISAGSLKIDSQVSQLVQAMATYSANNPGFDPTTAGVSSVPNDTTLQNALTAAWHA